MSDLVGIDIGVPVIYRAAAAAAQCCWTSVCKFYAIPTSYCKLICY